jgi:hypothetical protein
VFSSSASAARRGFRISRLRRLGFRDYRDYLKSPTWQSVKDSYWASNRPQACIYCEALQVQIHHLTYERVGGDELLTDLVAMCASCHHLVHLLERRRQVRLAETADLADDQRANAYRKAMAAAMVGREADRELLLDAFTRRPLHRQLAALMAFKAMHNDGPWRRVGIRRELRTMNERLARALRKVEARGDPANDLRVINATIVKTIEKLEHNRSSGAPVLAELLAIA